MRGLEVPAETCAQVANSPAKRVPAGSVAAFFAETDWGFAAQGLRGRSRLQ